MAMNAPTGTMETQGSKGLQVGAKKMPDVDTTGRFKTKNKKHSAKIIKKSNMVFITLSKLLIECG